MKIAYLVNGYPQASHSFIRREIAALETSGVPIRRISIRRPTAVVDPADCAELEKTFIIFNHLLQAFFLAMIWPVLHPANAWRSLKTASGIAYGGGGWIKQMLYLAEGWALASWLTRWGMSHVHAHFGTNSAAVAMYSCLSGGPGYSITIHGPEEFDAPRKLAIAEKIQHSKFAVAISDYGRSQLFRWCGLDDWKKIYVVRCGVDADFLRAHPQPVKDVPRLVCVGRLSEQKGQLLLIRAAAAVINKGVQFELVLVGDGPMRREIEAEIAELDLSRSVKITGWQSNAQVREHILSGRAMILPSFAEGLPVVIMEALALRRPVISTYVAGIPELVENGVNGWLVPAGSVERLTDCMIEVLRTPAEKLDKMSAAGAKRVAENHDAMIEAKKLAALFGKEMAVTDSDTPAAREAEAI